MTTKPRASVLQAKAELTAAQAALNKAIARRDRLIAEMVADPAEVTLYEIGVIWGLSIPRVHTIARQQGVTRGPTRWPTECKVDGCTRPHHSLGFCDLHYRRQRTIQS